MSATASETREYTVSGVPTVRVRDPMGVIAITPGTAERVEVRITRRVHGSLRVTDDDLRSMAVDIAQDGDTITVVATVEQQHVLSKRYSIDMDITVPPAANLDLRLAAGNLRIRGIQGILEAHVSAGNLEGDGVTLAGESRLTINAGNVTLRGALVSGASLDTHVNAGQVKLTLPRDTPASIDAITQVGSISVSGWSVDQSRQLTRQTATGVLGRSPTGSVRVRVDTGTIHLAAS